MIVILKDTGAKRPTFGQLQINDVFRDKDALMMKIERCQDHLGQFIKNAVSLHTGGLWYYPDNYTVEPCPEAIVYAYGCPK